MIAAPFFMSNILSCIKGKDMLMMNYLCLK